MVVHRAVAVAAPLTEEGGRSPRKVVGSEKKEDDTGRASYRGYIQPSYHKRHTAFGLGEAPSVADATLS